MDKKYEMRLFSEIPKDLRNKIVDLDGRQVDIMDNLLLPNSRIIMETSKNAGVIPHLIKSDETFHDFFSMKCRECGTTSDDLSNKLLETFPMR